MMGFGEADLASDRGSEEGKPLSSPVSCSICLEQVKDGGDRSTAKLQCGHLFHLDCIGSAFNVKGIMQCPNCRKTEKGNWLYSNGRSYSDSGIDEWNYDEDLYDLNYSEMSYGLHWCPYSRLTHLHSSFEDRESPAGPYHDLMARHSFFSDHPAPPPPPPPPPHAPLPPPSSSSHSCPYVAYFPLQPSPSSQPPSDGGADDAPVFYHPWGSLSGHSDLQSSANFPSGDFYYRAHEPNPYSGPSNARPGVAEPPAPPPVPATARPTRLNSDRLLRPGPFLSPFLFGHGSPAMAATAAAITAAAAASSTPAGAYHGSSRMTTYQPRSSSGLGSMSLGLQRPVGGRSMPPPPPPHPADSSRFYMFSGGPSLPEMDIGGGRFYAWERDRFSPFPLVQVERSSSWWGPFQWPSSENRSAQGRSTGGGSHRSTQSS